MAAFGISDSQRFQDPVVKELSQVPAASLVEAPHTFAYPRPQERRRPRTQDGSAGRRETTEPTRPKTAGGSGRQMWGGGTLVMRDGIAVWPLPEWHGENLGPAAYMPTTTATQKSSPSVSFARSTRADLDRFLTQHAFSSPGPQYLPSDPATKKQPAFSFGGTAPTRAQDQATAAKGAPASRVWASSSVGRDSFIHGVLHGDVITGQSDVNTKIGPNAYSVRDEVTRRRAPSVSMAHKRQNNKRYLGPGFDDDKLCRDGPGPVYTPLHYNTFGSKVHLQQLRQEGSRQRSRSSSGNGRFVKRSVSTVLRESLRSKNTNNQGPVADTSVSDRTSWLRREIIPIVAPDGKSLLGTRTVPMDTSIPGPASYDMERHRTAVLKPSFNKKLQTQLDLAQERDRKLQARSRRISGFRR